MAISTLPRTLALATDASPAPIFLESDLEQTGIDLIGE
jgi:hypothetical protein